MTGAQITGVVARIDWGYFVAAKINNYRVRKAKNDN